MKKIAMTAIILAGLAVFGGAPSSASYEGPWCLNASVGRAVTNICHFRTFEQCRNERGFYGSTAFCTQNPRYLPYWTARGQKLYGIQ